jgi:hypothetical protein
VLAEIVGPEIGGDNAASGGTLSTGFDFGTDVSLAPEDTCGLEYPGRAHFSAVAPAHQTSSTTDSATHGAIASAWTDRRRCRVVIGS